MTPLPPTELRVAALERLLGDPRDTAQPLSDAAVLAAGRRGELPLGGEPLLAAFGLHEEFVPRALGGRLTGLDALARLLRAVFRRDAALGRAYGTASLLPALTVWQYGTPEQRYRTAKLLLDGGRLAAAVQETSYYTDAGARLHTDPDGDGALTLTGRTPALVNAPRAAAFLVLPQRRPPGHGDTALLLDGEELPATAVREVAPPTTAGGARLPMGELRLDGWRVPERCVVGTAGQGSAAVVRALQLTRPLLPSMAVGCADSALRSVLSAVLAGSGGARSLTSRYVREVAAAAFADLLVADCLSLVALRSLHLVPDRSSLLSAASAYLVHRLLQQSTGDLLPVLGTDAQRDTPDGTGHGTFRKQLRDLAELPPGQAGAVAALSALVPQLATLARRSWTAGPGPRDAAPAALFRTEGGLPPLDADGLKVAAAGDPLTALLTHPDAALDSGPDLGAHGPAVRGHAGVLASGLAALAAECRVLPERDPAVLANPRGYALAERYALLAAGAACLGVWRCGPRGAGAQDGPGAAFLRRPEWLAAALARITLRLGLPVPDPPAGAPDPTDVLVSEAVARCHAGRSLDLYATALGGGQQPDAAPPPAAPAASATSAESTAPDMAALSALSALFAAH
ncbi:acyl-CoA dehydrogenase [Streptomyces sp. TRM 70351]|uniref:acyl-CoA dehydrogenase n=1 Tax=Streptomyces sp. TRM 70351 TaxID=3116552 RepID=UPI002E7C2CDC|nr:acyl-CoA dehydrogenase [Streptomyces sp. TRM 70351]MEE1929377.1 acyl-CoA dehydrogenase [Streptomyces sp. TRM 70351]